MTSLTKDPQPPTKKFFFECKLQDLPSLFWVFDRVCSAYWRNSHAKPHAIQLFLREPFVLTQLQKCWCWSKDHITLQGSCTQSYMHYSVRLLTKLAHTESNMCTTFTLFCSCLCTTFTLFCSNRSGDIHLQSHVRLGVFFAENLQNQLGAQVLKSEKSGPYRSIPGT